MASQLSLMAQQLSNHAEMLNSQAEVLQACVLDDESWYHEYIQLSLQVATPSDWVILIISSRLRHCPG